MIGRIRMVTRQFMEICKIETKCDHCGVILRPFEGMINDLCSDCTKKGIESEWDKYREVAGK